MAFFALFEHKKTHGKTTVRRTFYEKMRYKNVRLSLIPHSGIFEFVRIATSTIGNGVHNISFLLDNCQDAAAGFLGKGLRTTSSLLYPQKRILASIFLKNYQK